VGGRPAPAWLVAVTLALVGSGVLAAWGTVLASPALAVVLTGHTLLLLGVAVLLWRWLTVPDGPGA
jgi:protein-S-isoprenylcysteine O-methyltransferase Ste14